MKTEGTKSIWFVFMFVACLEAKSVSAQQVLRAVGESETDLVTSVQFNRTFRVNPNLFRLSVEEALTAGIMIENKSIQELVRDYFSASGIDVTGDSAPGFFFNERTGTLLVQGTIRQLEAVQKAVKALTEQPAHVYVSVEVRLMEATSETGVRRLKALLPQLQAQDFVLPSALPLQRIEDFSPEQRTAILTQFEFAKILKSAEQSQGIDQLSVPRTVTINGRQARIAFDDPPASLTDPPFEGGQRIKLNAE